MVVYLSLLVCLVGVLLYLFAKNGKLVDIGRLAFIIGLAAFLFTFDRAFAVLK